MSLCRVSKQKQISSLYFIFSPLNRCLSVVLSLDNGAYPENLHTVLSDVKRAFDLMFRVFGFCFRTLAVILVSDLFLKYHQIHIIIARDGTRASKTN